MKREVIGRDKVKAPETPHSPGIICGDLLYVSSQGPFDPTTQKVISGSVEEEARVAHNNVQAVIRAAGFHMYNVAKVTVFLADAKDFDGFNKAYREFFLAEGLSEMDLPARTVIEAKSAFGCKCEVEAIVGR